MTLLGFAVPPLVVTSLAAVALILLILLARRHAVAARAAAASAGLVAALAADRRALLAIAGDGGLVHGNGVAEGVFGPADDPLAPFLVRVGGDERGQDELERLRIAASHGVPHHAEIALAGPDGSRDWWSLAVAPMDAPAGAVLWSAEDVTGRRAIEETLRREHEWLSDFLDFMPVGCYSADTEGRFRYVNQTLAEWLGRPPKELLGQDIGELLGVVPNPEDDRAEMRLRGKGGDVFQAFVSHSVFDDAGETLTRSVVVRDLMPERMWERALKQAERRVHWLFEDAPVGIVLLDPDGSLAMSNQAFRTMLGLAEDVAGRPMVDFIAAEDRPAAADLLSRVLMGTSPGAHLEVRLAGGRELVASAYVNPTAEGGRVTGLMLHFIDTTDRRNLEIQFAQSQKMQAMGQLAGGVAHDFNNLLTAMIGFCDLMLQRHKPGDASFADIMQIKQNANRAASLVRQLLAFSRRQAMTPQPLSVTDALAELTTLLHRLLGERIELKVIHTRDVGVVRVDPGQFDQVIINLAVNARDAMPGGGALSIRTDSAEFQAPVQRGTETIPPGRYVTIQVADTGTGISKETISRIFEPFFSTKEVGAGTGLGLSTVYGIVRQNDGYIFVESTIGQGATFTVFLPRFEGELAKPSKPAEVPTEHDLTGKGAILLVEDEDAVRTFASRALRNKGYRVTEAANGEGALDVLKTGEPLDVLITDVVMPGMDGATLARLVRMERPEMRVLLISGYSEDVAFDGLSDDPAVRFLPKPFSLKQLAGAVKELMAEE
jgi:two-component system cell cycle sensor histidine kinase/response regulator CckA